MIRQPKPARKASSRKRKNSWAGSRQELVTKTHWLIHLTDPMCRAYTTRRSAIRAAEYFGGYVISDCGDHWGLEAGFVKGQQLSAAGLQAVAPELEKLLDVATLPQPS